MRKRAQIKSKPTRVEPKHTSVKKTPKYEEKAKKSLAKNWWVALILVGIFFSVLFYNTYYNASSGIAMEESFDDYGKYLLSGPDPYYNMRIVEETSETGVYQFYSENDDLLNYPIGRTGSRAPLLNMMALGFSNFLKPFMSEIDAIGYSMQFIPALFGALLVIPVYFLGKTLFNKKAGLIAAFLMAIIPIHIGSGHGSAFSLFDHDSLNLLLFFTTFLFIIYGLKEKDKTKSMLYSVLAGISLAGLSMVWVEARFLYVLIGGYAIVQYLIDIFTNKIEQISFRVISITLLTGYLLSLPVVASRPNGFSFDVTFFMVVGVIGFGFVYYMFGNRKIPWTLSLPLIFTAGFFILALMYLTTNNIIDIPLLGLSKISSIIFGTGIYGNKVSMTIAEANTYQISHTVMSFGPALYWLGWGGFIFLLWNYYKDKLRRDYLFIIVIFILDLWLAGTAGRFLNDMVPLIAILAGWMIWFMVDKIDYKQMVRSIRSAGGGIHGIRRGMKLLHIFGILFLAFVVIMPNAYVAMDAAVPTKTYQKEDGNWTNLKWEMFGEDHSGAFGLSLYKERYWSDAFNWLSEQDTDIEDPLERPAFISWWDYGFYEVALGQHPTVADNFQDGIPPASNFHTATSEKEAVAVWIVRLLEGNAINNGAVSEDVKQVLINHLGENNANELVSWAENPEVSPSYSSYIDEQFNKYITSEEINNQILRVGAQWKENALYHDFVDMINTGNFSDNRTGLTDDEVTWLYHDIQDITGYSIRYYGVEGYDKQIFNIFAFLSDKSLVMLGAPEDDFVKVLYSGKEYTPAGSIKRAITNEPLQDYLDMEDSEKRYIRIESTPTSYKDSYFDTMFYKTYVGPYDVDSQTGSRTEYEWQLPCINMKHFYAEYISDMQKYQYYNTGKASVVIAKYYEGAIINGNVSFNGSGVDCTISVLKNLTYYEGAEQPINHDSFDYIASGAGKTDNFSVLLGAGAYLQITKSVGDVSFVLKTINFTGDTNTVYAPITEDDAMRRDGSNYERYLPVEIQPGSVSGYVFDDLNEDGSFNVSSDIALSDIKVEVEEITKISSQSDGSQIIDELGDSTNTTSNDEGYYSINDLYPGFYRVKFYDSEDYLIDMTDMEVSEGENTYNSTKPINATLEGTLYYDDDLNGEYDSGEEKANVDVELYYSNDKDLGNNDYAAKKVGTVKTDSSGRFEFTSLKPVPSSQALYTLRVTMDDYEKEVYVYPEANKTTTQNISLDLVPSTVTGTAKYDNEGIEDVQISFTKDMDYNTNSAVNKTITTDENGTYSVELIPGKYNVSIEKKATQGTMQTLVYSAPDSKLSIDITEDTKTENFELTKHSVTVTGAVTYESLGRENVNITFTPKNTSLGAKSAKVSTDENGEYSVELFAHEETNVTYEISAKGSNFTGNNDTYTASSEIDIKYSNIAEGITDKDIMLAKEEES